MADKEKAELDELEEIVTQASEDEAEAVEETVEVAEVAVDEVAEEAPEVKKAAASGTVPLVACIVAAVAALVLGLVLGQFVHFGGGATAAASGSLAGKTTITEEELDTVVGSYNYGGSSYNLTAREVIEDNSSLDAARQDDGTYTVPSADYILSSARNAIMQREVEAQGITVSDEDIDAYAEETLGSSDYSTIASEYSMTEDQVKSILSQSCGVKKLYDSVVGDTSTGALPEAPVMYEDGEEDTPTAEYYEYIVGLLGDEWDDAAKDWARTDGQYYASMSTMDFSSGEATYAQAETAYYVAYQAYSQTSSDSSAKWTEYINGLLANASIAISTLIS